MKVHDEAEIRMLRQLLVSRAPTTNCTLLVFGLLVALAGRATAEEPGSEAKQPGVNAPPVSAHMLGDADLFDLTMANLSDDALVDSLDLETPELAEVKEAAAQNSKMALEAFSRYLARRERPVDITRDRRINSCGDPCGSD